MMNRKEFYEYVKDNVLSYLPDSFRNADVELVPVEKGNGLSLTSLTIREEGKTISPNVYLDPLYHQYRKGKDVDACVGDAANLRIELGENMPEVDLYGIQDYGVAKSRLQVRICDPERNEARLKDKVVTQHGDFAAYYAVNLEENGSGIMSMPVTLQMMENWGVDAMQIHADAMTADERRGVMLMDMDAVMESFLLGEETESLLGGERRADQFGFPMFCLTNAGNMNGASLILNEGIRKQIGEFMGGDYFVLPSSIHEVLLVPDNGMFEEHELNGMVHQVNGSDVTLENQLSDKVQFCDGKTGVMENAHKRAARLEMEKTEKDSGRDQKESGGIHGRLKEAKAEIQANESLKPGKIKAAVKDKAMAL